VGAERVHEPSGDKDLVARPSFTGEAKLVIGLANVRLARLAAPARPAGHDALRHTADPGPEILDAGTDGLDSARPLVPQRERIADVRGVNVPAQELQVRAAKPAVRRPHHHLLRTGLEQRALYDLDRPGSLHYQRAP